MIDQQTLSQLCTQVQHQIPQKLFDLWVASDDDVEVRLRHEAQNQGPNARSEYEIGCIHTLLEGLVITSLAEEGRIDVEAPVGEYLPELSKEGFCPGNNIRVHHLLAHATGYHATSGTPEKAGYTDWNELVEYLSYSEPAFPPGTVCSWNGIGRIILSSLIQRAMGLPLDVLVQKSVRTVTGREAALANVERGWSSLVLELDELVTYARAKLKSAQIQDLIHNFKVPVVRSPVSSRSGNPVAYAFGLALYPDGLWGQSGNGPFYSLGLRFNDSATFGVALAIGAPPFSRDLVLQLLCTACGFVRRNAAAHVMGSILECRLSELSGTYSADWGNLIRVTVSGTDVSCSFSRNGNHIVNVPLKVVDDYLLAGDGRWDAHQVEFFRHPVNGRICLTFGQICYIKI